MLLPYKVDVPPHRPPWANYAIVAVTILAFLALEGGALSDRLVGAMVLQNGSAWGWLGHVLLHAGWAHLLGNMFALYVFGGPVCARLGNGYYAGAYVLLGLAAAAAHIFFSDSPAVGASGAVNGVIGMFLVWYPFTNVRCLSLWFVIGRFDLRSIWLVLIYLVLDLYGAMGGSAGVANWAHLGGLAGGVALATVLTVTGLVPLRTGEFSLLDAVARNWARSARGMTPAEEVPRDWRGRTQLRDASVPTLPPGFPAGRSMHRFTCPVCDNPLAAPLGWRGRRARCGHCDAVIEVPVR